MKVPATENGDTDALERRIRESIKQWEADIGYSFSGDHVVALVREHYGISIDWLGAHELCGDSGKSLRSILATKRQADVSKVIRYGFVAVGIVLLLTVLNEGGGPSRHTDGVFESATDKMDKGLPLNELEAKRIYDVLNYKQNKQIEDIERRNGER